MSSNRRYDVFLSFRGEDTRRTFVSHLYSELNRKGITTFKGCKELETRVSGEITEGPTGTKADITDEAIRYSKIAVVVTSESYAASVWCLEELVKILDFQAKGSLTVIPIFYEVDPSDLWKQTGVLEKQFKEHEIRETLETVETWRKALTKLANIDGADSRDCENDAEVIRKVTDDISYMLKHRKLDSSDYPVGMERQVKAVYELLDLESTDETLMMGIWGVPGVGKTVLARYLYEQISPYFHTHVFLEDVYNIYSKEVHGEKNKRNYQDGKKVRAKVDNMCTLFCLKGHAKGDSDYSPSLEKNILLKEILREARMISSPNLDSGAMKAKLACRKVLLVADGVNGYGQFKDVDAIASGLGPGSRVILTTQDKTLLDGCEETRVYEVECLRYDEALQLFCQFAFNQKYPPNSSFEWLSFRAVHLSGCLPLALKVLGSFLHGKGKEDWETALKQLQEDKDKDMMERLRNSHSRADDGHVTVSETPSDVNVAGCSN